MFTSAWGGGRTGPVRRPRSLRETSSSSSLQRRQKRSTSILIASTWTSADVCLCPHCLVQLCKPMQVFSCLLSRLLPGRINPKNDLYFFFYKKVEPVWTKAIYFYGENAYLLNGNPFSEREIPVRLSCRDIIIKKYFQVQFRSIFQFQTHYSPKRLTNQCP